MFCFFLFLLDAVSLIFIKEIIGQGYGDLFIEFCFTTDFARYLFHYSETRIVLRSQKHVSTGQPSWPGPWTTGTENSQPPPPGKGSFGLDAPLSAGWALRAPTRLQPPASVVLMERRGQRFAAAAGGAGASALPGPPAERCLHWL